eukprot:g8746.t1
MEQEGLEERGFWDRVADYLDIFGFAVECVRGCLIDPFVFLFRRYQASVFTPFRPKQSLKGEEIQKSDEEKDKLYCLHRTKLSFFDEFTPFNGIPAYLMTLQNVFDAGTSDLEGPRRTEIDSYRQSSFSKNQLQQRVCCSFSHDSSRFAICYANGEIAVWDSDHGVIMKRTMFALTKANAVSFLGNSNNIVLICTQDYKCWKWDISGDDSEPIKFFDIILHTKIWDEEMLSQRADFFMDGTVLILSAVADCLDGLTLSIVLIQISSEYSMFEHYSNFPLFIDKDCLISQVSMSPNGTGLLVGLMDEPMENSYCILWPDFKTEPRVYRELDIGTLGSWSLDGKYVVTWIMTEMSNHEDINRSSAFVWNVNEILKNLGNLEYTFKYKIINPFKAKVFWCSIVADMDQNCRLIMGIASETTRFLFWDMESMVHTHTIETNIPTHDMILCNKKAWIESYVEHKIVVGLSPVAVTRDGEYFGLVLGWPSKVLIWDARLGIQVLNVSLKDIQANHFKGGINLILDRSRDKFAIFEDLEALVFCPPTTNEDKTWDKQLLETQMVEFENYCMNTDKDSSYKMRFSGDGNTLGVLCIGFSEMQLWNLPKGTTYILDAADLDEGNINDFCLSNNGEHSAACTDNSILVWKYEAKIMQPINDGSKIVLCMKDGSIRMCWTVIAEKASNVDVEKGITSHTSSREANIKQKRQRPMAGLLEPLIGHGSVPSQTPLESNEHKLTVLVQYHYETKNIAGELEDAKFQVSPKFERVIRVSHSHDAEEWNLETEEMTENADVDEENIIKSSESYSRVSSINKRVSKRLQASLRTHLNGTSITLTKQTTVVQSSNKNIIVAANAPSSGIRHRTNLLSYDVEYVEEKHEDSHSVYIVNLDDEKRRRRLNGNDLNPGSGLAISEDGRHVACFAGAHASKILVWNAYGSEILLPDYHFLDQYNVVGNKEVIMKQIQPMFDRFQENLFQFQHRSGMSVLNEAMLHCNSDLLSTFLQYARNNKIKVSLLFSKTSSNVWMQESVNNAIEASIACRSPQTLKLMLQQLLDGMTHEVEAVAILGQSLTHILQEYSSIFCRVLIDPKMLGLTYEIEVPESTFEGRNYVTITSDSLLLSREEAIQLWDKNVTLNSKQSTNSPRVRAIAATLRYPDACKTSCRGLLHELLVNGAHYRMFDSLLVRAIVEYKWRNHGRTLTIYEVLHHVVLLIVYTLYCFMLCTDVISQTESHKNDEENSSSTKYSLICCVVLAVPCLYRELRQCALYARHHEIYGLICWITSAWNWIELLSYFNIVVVIPSLEFLLLKNGKKFVLLSVIVAIECVLLWCRILYYARMSRKLGKFVTVIAAVVSAVIPFLFIAFCVMFGFAVAFHVLYRHLDASTLEGNGEVIADDLLSVHKSFGTFGRTLFTVFGFIFGDFNLDNIYLAPNVPAATVLFVLYMVIITTTFLNMLIAMMGQEFEGIHRGEYSRFLKARAMVIDDNEMMISHRGNEKISYGIGKYLHILIPSHLNHRVIRGSALESKKPEDSIREVIQEECRRQFDKLPHLVESTVAKQVNESLTDSSTKEPRHSDSRSNLRSRKGHREPAESSIAQGYSYDSDGGASRYSLWYSSEDE